MGSDNDLSPVHHQAIIWTTSDLLSIQPPETYFNEILIKLQFTFSLKKCISKWCLQNDTHFFSSSMCLIVCGGISVPCLGHMMTCVPKADMHNAWISNYNPQYSVGCNYLSMPYVYLLLAQIFSYTPDVLICLYVNLHLKLPQIIKINLSWTSNHTCNNFHLNFQTW